ncbi:hypothetical protein [Cellulomonas shaoxiangyii]|uniref:hypothetical protein n=1 Tax=Cellulomonas shaoxiangyii TaxID=2566013 RepID=UPI001FB57E52|nr:hypothetical protein [Cellulomonas shaoxiangyii]
MAYDTTEPHQDAPPEAPSRVAAGVLSLVFFFGSFALIAWGFDIDGALGMTIAAAGILTFALAYAIPTAIVPALDRGGRR